MSSTAVAVEREVVVPRSRTAPRPIPMSRIVGVELRKMFDTRSGFWLMATIAIGALLATGAVILWAPDDQLTYSTFASAIGFPMSVILPMVAILSVTSEWTQRIGLTTFTLLPSRGRVIGAGSGINERRMRARRRASASMANTQVIVVCVRLVRAVGAWCVAVRLVSRRSPDWWASWGRGSGDPRAGGAAMAMWGSTGAAVRYHFLRSGRPGSIGSRCGWMARW